MKISGLLPVHNGEKFIDMCLPLILKNLNLDDELIIVDNGSTDGSKIKLEKWSGIDSRIRLITTNNCFVGQINLCRDIIFYVLILYEV